MFTCIIISHCRRRAMVARCKKNYDGRTFDQG